MDAWAAKRLRTFEDAERGLCFGRLDFETMLRPLYVGRRWVHDDEQRQLVVNWQAPAARPFYTATPQDPHGVTLRRRFRTDGRRLLDIADEALDGIDRRRRRGRRLPARGARAGPRPAHARHRRDDPGRPVPADHPRPGLGARDPGRPGHRQDSGRPAPCLVAALHAARTAATPGRARRRAEPDVHGVRLTRPAGARRGRRRAARRRRARGRRGRRSCATRPPSRG